MSREYNQLSDTYDPYTCAPYYDYLFTAPNGLTPNNPITSPKDIIGEIKDPGTTTVYNTLPPPPTKYGITTSEAFTSGDSSWNVYIFFIIILALLIFMLVTRMNKVIKAIKKLRKTKDSKKD